MLIDCDACRGRGPRCADCVIGVLLDQPPMRVEFDDSEVTAVRVLAASGLIPPLRLVPPLRAAVA
ncbi:MAG: hypothetical protein FWD74_05385 [Actinomycetia bacterium]|nr:hypothetical protein [Actinomycetes bacterium]